MSRYFSVYGANSKFEEPLLLLSPYFR